jgi:hypothetical protein
MKDSLLGRRPFSLGENIFRRSAYHAVGGYPRFGGGSGADLTLLLKLARHGRIVNLHGPSFRFRHHSAAISSGASKHQQIAINGAAECCTFLTEWNRRTPIASSLSIFYWTLRWYHACLKNWRNNLTDAQRNEIASFARRQWHLPRFVHATLLAGTRLRF